MDRCSAAVAGPEPAEHLKASGAAQSSRHRVGERSDAQADDEEINVIELDGGGGGGKRAGKSADGRDRTRAPHGHKPADMMQRSSGTLDHRAEDGRLDATEPNGVRRRAEGPTGTGSRRPQDSVRVGTQYGIFDCKPAVLPQ